jgi:hypothetical protein
MRPPPGTWCNACYGQRWWTERQHPAGWRCMTCPRAGKGGDRRFMTALSDEDPALPTPRTTLAARNGWTIAVEAGQHARMVRPVRHMMTDDS